MVVSEVIQIESSSPAVWSVVSDVERWANVIRGVEKIEVVARPATGMPGLRWKETRLLFDKPATVEKWVTDSVENEYFSTRAEQDGFVFSTTLQLAKAGSGVLLTSIHQTDAQTFVARLRALPLFLFKAIIRKTILEDLKDIKAAVEATVGQK